MSMVNAFKSFLLSAAMAGQTIKMMLMATGFTINIDSDDTYAILAASELAAGNGYTTGGLTLTGFGVATDDVNDRSDATWSDAVWTASGGPIGPSPAADIYIDSDVVTPKINIGDFPFGSDQTASDGGTFTVSNPTVRLT